MPQQIEITREVAKSFKIKIKPYLSFKVPDNKGKDTIVYVIKIDNDYEFFIPQGKNIVSIARFPIVVLDKFAKVLFRKQIPEIAKMMSVKEKN